MAMIQETIPDTLRIDVEQGDGVRIVRLTGELDLVYADEVRATLTSVVGQTVIVDLAGLEFIDSSGLSALLTARRRVASGGDRLVLLGARGAALRAFEVAGLDDVLEGQPGAG